MALSVVCYLGIGTNSGDRKKNISLALAKIRQIKNTRLIKVSKIIESKPQGMLKEKEKFLNAVIKIKTSLSALNLLKKLQAIEVVLGRPKNHKPFAARTIDLDILLYAEKIIKNKILEVPHPKLFEREFVLEPLMEVL